MLRPPEACETGETEGNADATYWNRTIHGSKWRRPPPPTLFSDEVSRRLERGGNRVIHPLEPCERQLLPHLLGDVFEVFPVARGQHDASESGPVRGDDFLLDAADRKHEASEADLSGHRGVAAHGAIGHERDERHEHRHPGARAVFWRRARRHMDMDVGLLEARRVDAIGDCAILNDAERSLCAFLHHFAQLPGEDQPSAAWS